MAKRQAGLDGAIRNGGLSRARHAVQPYTFAVGIVGPLVDLGEKFDSSVGMASGVVFVGVRVCGTWSGT